MDIFDKKDAEPMLIGETREAFDSDYYIFELKLDGERGLAYLDKDRVELRNKRQMRMLPKFPELQALHRQVKKRCILDGEFIVARDGKPDFDEIKRRAIMSDPFKIQLAAAKLPVSFVVYDIIYLEDELVTGLPLMERKKLLAKNVKENGTISLSRYIEREGIRLFELTKAQGLEGVVAKLKNSRYYLGKRTKDWIKIKNMQDDDFVICGYIIKTEIVTSLVIGQYRRAEMIYKGHVTMGISKEDFKVIEVTKRRDTHPFKTLPAGNQKAVWLEPVNVCRVEYMENTEGGNLRHAVYRGLRLDKAPEECLEQDKRD